MDSAPECAGALGRGWDGQYEEWTGQGGASRSRGWIGCAGALDAVVMAGRPQGVCKGQVVSCQWESTGEDGAGVLGAGVRSV